MASDDNRRVHGGPDLEELRSVGIEPTSLVDFSVNVNPYGPTTSMRDAIRDAAIDRYPDPTAALARAALAGVWDVAPDSVVLGAGAAELLWSITRATVRAGEPVVIVEPTFSEARAAAEAVGAVVHEVRALEQDGFRHDARRVVQTVTERRARLVYLCAPNNPTGLDWPVSEIGAIIRRCPDALFVVDQSFLSLSDRHEDAAVRLPDNAVCIRSLTKDHSIPGARVGALIATPTVAGKLERLRPAWSTGAVTQAAAIAASAEQGFVAESRARLFADRAALIDGLRALGLTPLPSSTVFVLVHLGRARDVRAALLRDHGILVRDCSSFGMPDHLRLAARPARDRDRLLAALRARHTAS